MRILTWLFALLVVLAGLLFGALNPDPVRVDLYFTAFQLALGPALLLAALAGALLGGVAVMLGVVLPLRRRLRRQRPAVEPAPASTGDADAVRALPPGEPA
jgi:uncharacterized integral membrane protein